MQSAKPEDHITSECLDLLGLALSHRGFRGCREFFPHIPDFIRDTWHVPPVLPEELLHHLRSPPDCCFPACKDHGGDGCGIPSLRLLPLVFRQHFNQRLFGLEVSAFTDLIDLDGCADIAAAVVLSITAFFICQRTVNVEINL